MTEYIVVKDTSISVSSSSASIRTQFIFEIPAQATWDASMTFELPTTCAMISDDYPNIQLWFNGVMQEYGVHYSLAENRTTVSWIDPVKNLFTGEKLEVWYVPS